MSISATTPPRSAPRSHRAWRTARRGLARSGAGIAKMASAARHRYRCPALVISSFGCIDASAWITFGIGAGLLAIGISLFALEMLGGDE